MAISIRENAPGPGEYNIDKNHSGENAMPNCTGYAFHRAYEEFGTFPTTYMAGASDGINIPNEEGDGYAYRNDRNGVAGDVLVYSGHVEFVEGDKSVSASYYTPLVYPETSDARNKTALDVYNYTQGHGSSNAPSSNGTIPTRGEYGTGGWRFGHRGNAYDGNYLGRLHCDREGGGGHDPGGDEPEPGPGSGGVLLTDRHEVYTTNTILECASPDARSQSSGDQDGPKTPSVYDQGHEDDDYYAEVPGSHGRTGKYGDKLYTYTYQRYITYKGDETSQKFIPQFSDGELESSAELSGKEYGDYDTAVSGEIPGGLINWSD